MGRAGSAFAAPSIGLGRPLWQVPPVYGCLAITTGQRHRRLHSAGRILCFGFSTRYLCRWHSTTLWRIFAARLKHKVRPQRHNRHGRVLNDISLSFLHVLIIV